MFSTREYLLIDNSYKSIYIKNNNQIDKNNVTDENLFYYITKDVELVLDSLFIPASLKGYVYWKEAVFIFIMNLKTQIIVCKDIYPAVCKKFNKTVFSIEKAMRDCFEHSLYNSSKNDVNFIFHYFENYLLNPHNCQLLHRIVELISSKQFQNEKHKLLLNH